MSYSYIIDALTGERSPNIRRDEDDSVIPCDPANMDWLAFQDWLADGHAPHPPRTMTAEGDQPAS